MEIEMEMVDSLAAHEGTAADRLLAAAERLEAAAERLGAQEMALEAAAARLKNAEATIAQLRAGTQGGRKTLAAGTMMAREGSAVEAGSLDAALSSLSIEQRIAVKAGLLRSGLIG